METAIYQDGAIASLKNPALSRISKISREGQLLAQFAYPVDAIPFAPAEGKFSDNGISEILAINDHQLLVIERAGVQAQSGVFDFYIRIYLMEINGATDVKNLPALVDADFIPVQKRLVLNLNTLGLKKIDNLEGIAFGAKLENGHDSLVLVSDDNFEKPR